MDHACVPDGTGNPIDKANPFGTIPNLGKKRSPHEATCQRIASDFHQGRSMSVIFPHSHPESVWLIGTSGYRLSFHTERDDVSGVGPIEFTAYVNVG